MSLEKIYHTVEDAINTLGIDVESARCEGEGQWIIGRGEDTEVFIDVWQPHEHTQWEYFKEDKPIPVFQVLAPVTHLPSDEKALDTFLKEVLYVNHNMFYGSFTVNLEENMCAIRFRRITDGLNRVEMIEPIEAVGFYAENLRRYLSEKYGVKKN
jgi:hypothetical protein